MTTYTATCFHGLPLSSVCVPECEAAKRAALSNLESADQAATPRPGLDRLAALLRGALVAHVPMADDALWADTAADLIAAGVGFAPTDTLREAAQAVVDAWKTGDGHYQRTYSLLDGPVFDLRAALATSEEAGLVKAYADAGLITTHDNIDVLPDPDQPAPALDVERLARAIHAAICPQLGRPCSGAHAIGDARAIARAYEEDAR